MKQGIVKFSKEFISESGLKEWIGCEYQFDMDTEHPQDVYEQAKNDVMLFREREVKRAIENSMSAYSPAPPTGLPIINKAEERLGILIENASTKEELMGYKNDCSTVYLADLWATKLSLLNNK